MKTTKNVLTAILLLLLFAVGCEKKEKETETEKKPCSCENPLSNYQFSHKEAYLFKDSIPMEAQRQMHPKCEDENGRWIFPRPEVYWIIYDSETKSAALTTFPYCGGLIIYCAICNFSEFIEIEEWDIPENGCKVYFEGITYEPCVKIESWLDSAAGNYDYTLTKLEKR